MAHYKTMYDDSDMLFAHDLQGKSWVLEIERVYAGELVGEKGRKSKKPFVAFKGRKKKLALNKSNGKTIARLYSVDTSEWAGKLVEIYPTTTEFGGETVDCIRIRPHMPNGKASAPTEQDDAEEPQP